MRGSVFFLTVMLGMTCLGGHVTLAQPIPMAKPVVGQKETINVIENSIPVLVDVDKASSKKGVQFPPISYDKPLTSRDISLYKEIFAAQKQKDWDRADALLGKVNNTVLLGHVYANRLLNSSYDTSQTERDAWVAQYGDHPQRSQVSQKKHIRPTKIAGTLAELRYFSHGSKYISDRYNSGQRYELRLVKQEVDKTLDRGAVTAALNFFNGHRVQKYIDPVDKAQILASIAAHYLYLNHKDKARSVALKALKTSEDAPLAGWVAGLIAWIENDMAQAARYFTIASNAPYASPWMTSAASYWGARASTRAGLYRDVSPLLAKAVRHQRTFYGLIATKAMGYGYDFNWTMPEFTVQDHNVLLGHPVGARAVALAQVGRLRQAEEELFYLPVKDNPAMAQAAIALANHYDMAGYAMRFSLAMHNPAGGYYDAGLFPVSSWTRAVKNDDRTALLNAFIRQESRFIARASNKTGATGLMQLMPETAAFVSKNGVYKTEKGRLILNDPMVNVKIGSQYLDHLMELEAVDRDLFSLAIAYNAGPGKLRRWKNDLPHDDPLLFIELIPSSETRAFVERVVTNYWVYQMQIGIEPKTLVSVARGDWPKIQ